jgi:hypothetical protein
VPGSGASRVIQAPGDFCLTAALNGAHSSDGNTGIDRVCSGKASDVTMSCRRLDAEYAYAVISWRTDTIVMRVGAPV